MSTHLVQDFLVQLVAVLLTEIAEGAYVTSTTPDPNKHDVKMDSGTSKPRPPGTADRQTPIADSFKAAGNATPLSMAAESAITFVSVFVVGCVITLSVYSWKKFKPSNWRVAVPYQYSALNQFDNDPEDEVNDLENNLDMLVEDSTSDEEEISAPPETGSKTVGAIDFTPADANAPATLPISITESSTVSSGRVKANGRKQSGSHDGSEGHKSAKSSRHSSVNDDVFLNMSASSVSNPSANPPVLPTEKTEEIHLNDLMAR